MKPRSSEPPSAQSIRLALNDVGVTVDVRQAEMLAAHASAVFAANARFNLTRIGATDDFLRLHIVDSLLPWSVSRVRPPIVDIGSGAGFPGIPLAIVHGGPVILCESVGKKSSFLQDCVDALEIPAEVFPGRAEELALQRPAFAANVTARAVTSLASLVELAAPLLVNHGLLYAFKGAPSVDELMGGRAAAATCGMVERECREYALPTSGERRCLVTYERVGRPRVVLPRRPGLAQHHPLGG